MPNAPIDRSSCAANRLLRLRIAGLIAGLGLGVCGGRAALPVPLQVAAGEAAQTIKQLAQQARVTVIFPTEDMAAVRTQAVDGVRRPADALRTMLEGTAFMVIEDPATGGLAVKRRPAAAAPRPPPAPLPAHPPLPDVESETVRLEPLQVTGSHIRYLESQGIAPIAEYSHRTLALSGAHNLADFLQLLPFNSGAQQTINNPSGFTQGDYDRGISTVNPRGLGPQRVLVLVDGHRAVNFAVPTASGASVFDLNSMPLEAVESVDYLKDGASGVYGSDAITGVINLKLRRDFRGLAAEVAVGDVLQPGRQGGNPFLRTATVIAGTQARGTSVLIEAGWQRQTGNTIADYDRSKNTDFSALGIRGANDSSLSSWPFNVNLTAAQAAAAGLSAGAGWYVAGGGVPQVSPNAAQFVFVGANKNAIPDANRYNFAPTSQILPDRNDANLLLKVERQLKPSLSFFLTVLASDNRTHILYTPTSVNSTAVTVGSASNLAVGLNPLYLSIPAANPFNPFGSALGGGSGMDNSFLGRILFGPNRTYDIESIATNVIAGLDGRIGGDWSWNLSLTAGRDDVTDNANNNIRSADLQAALNGTLPGLPGAYLNPFGPTPSADLVRRLFVTSVSTAQDTTYDADVSASGPLFALPLSLAVGAEWRQERLDNEPDTVNYAVIPVNSTPFDARRDVASAYAELEIPAAGRYLEFRVAVRHDRYSQFGGTTNPKFAVLSHPFGFLKLRASFSRSFKAPDLGQLFNQPLISYSSSQTFDPLNPAVPAQPYAQLTGGNAALRPETGRVGYAGAVIDAGAVVSGLSFTVDYTSIRLASVITSFSTPAQLEASFPNLVVRGTPTALAPAGPIEYFDYIPVNAAAYYWRGFDLGARYTSPATAWGRFSGEIDATRIVYFAYDAGTGLGPVNRAGQYNVSGASPGAIPRWTGEARTAWSGGSWTAGLNVIFKGPWFDNANAPIAVWRERALALLNATVAWQSPAWGLRFTLACENLLNTQPPANAFASPSDGFDISTYGAWAVGRFVTFKVARKF